MLVWRGALAVIAVVVAAWFLIGIRQAHEVNHASSIIGAANSLSAKQSAHVTSLLNSADTLNPGTEVDMLRAEAALLVGDRPRATQILERVTQREPDNAQAWVALAQAAYGNGPVINHALANIYRLDPRGAH